MKITEKAMLSRLTVSQWSARKHDKKISDEVAHSHNAQSDAGRYNKVLIAGSALADIVKAQGEARTFHYENTLPWMDDGQRILPAANFFAYSDKMRNLRATFEAEVAAFIDAYPDYVNDARVRLNDMFNESDYPSVSEIRRRFGFDIVILPLPSASDFRVDIGNAEEAKIRAEIEARTNAALNGAISDIWTRIHTAVSHMAERLKAYDGTREGSFRDSLVSNVRDLVDLLPRLNMTNDAKLSATVDELRAKLCPMDAQTLRDDPTLRNQVRHDAESILDAMSGYCAAA